METKKNAPEVIDVTSEDMKVVVRSPYESILSAVKEGTDLDRLEKVLEIGMRWEANEAKKAYHQAMTDFKANPPEILKDKHVSFPVGGKTTEYDHASLANVVESINKGLSQHGLSAAWVTNQGEGGISVTCRITHSLGHSEETTLAAAPDNSGSKNAIQALGSTVTYLQRYTLLALTGLATKNGSDDDGNGGPTVVISDKQLNTITDYLDNLGADKPKFCKHFEIDEVKDLSADRFNEAVAMLKAKEAKLNKAKEEANATT